MRRNRHDRILPALLIAIVASGAFAASVVMDESVDFSRYETFAFKNGTPARRETAQKWIENAITRELESRGLRAATSDAQLYVASHVLVDRQSLEQLDDPAYWEFLTGNTTADPYDLGAATLVVELVDVASQKIVWRSALAVKVAGPLDQAAQRRVEKVVRKILKKLPI